MDQDWGIPAEAWSRIDLMITSLRGADVPWAIRESIGGSVEDARHIGLQRFHFLRAKCPEAFAWMAYPCRDYLDSEWSLHGCWDDPYSLLIRPASEVEEHHDLGMLVIGGPGVDGIHWGYRRSEPGLWEYRPIDRDFTELAPSLDALTKGRFLER